MLTKPLDAVILQMKIMNFNDPGHALMRCITPPDVEQVRSFSLPSSLLPPLPPFLPAEPVTTVTLICVFVPTI